MAQQLCLQLFLGARQAGLQAQAGYGARPGPGWAQAGLGQPWPEPGPGWAWPSNYEGGEGISLRFSTLSNY